MNDNTRSSSIAAIIVGSLVILGLALLGVGAWVAGRFDISVRLPFLVMAGLIALLGVLAAMAVAFKTIHLANQTEALGLPKGSVRAVIALSLILIFAVVTVYLFSDLSTCVEPAAEATAKSGSAKTTTIKPTVADTTATTTVVTSTTGTTTTGTTTAVTTTDPNKPPSSSDSQKARASAAQDFAKQLLIMLGTLITSITSFYFGSKTATDANPTRPSTPKLTGLDPTTLASGGLPKPVNGEGSGLQLVETVTLRGAKGGTVGATGVSSSDSTVTFTVPTGTAADSWTVVVKTKDGVEATAPAPLMINNP
jgi:hypothetical protein